MLDFVENPLLHSALPEYIIELIKTKAETACSHISISSFNNKCLDVCLSLWWLFKVTEVSGFKALCLPFFQNYDETGASILSVCKAYPSGMIVP